MLFLIPVMDMLMLSPAACFIFCGVICGCCCNSMCGMNGWFTQYIVKACQKLRYYKFYGRSSIVISATFLFCCIQPLILTITLPWTIFISRVWAHNHKRVLFHPLEVGFDPGGHYWLLAMRQLSYSVLLAQLALAAVHAMNQVRVCSHEHSLPSSFPYTPRTAPQAVYTRPPLAIVTRAYSLLGVTPALRSRTATRRSCSCSCGALGSALDE